ncbi:hypothetical protein E3N88_42380 [Mikania micrantha]|uniref:Uncharacterized protein n=1 Tax=Mikania micrantha TaxID=192012 RepID=A0A5N6LK64_9ASTR|nr:hypothetical protein E3N88_42380 [Mikania micrantha]
MQKPLNGVVIADFSGVLQLPQVALIKRKAPLNLPLKMSTPEKSAITTSFRGFCIDNEYRLEDKFSFKIIRKTPPNSPCGPREVEAELLLPKPMGEKYDRGDFQLWWRMNEVTVQILRYQNKIEALTFDDDKTLRDKKNKDNDRKADEMQLEVVMEDDK